MITKFSASPPKTCSITLSISATFLAANWLTARKVKQNVNKVWLCGMKTTKYVCRGIGTALAYRAESNGMLPQWGECIWVVVFTRDSVCYWQCLHRIHTQIKARVHASTECAVEWMGPSIATVKKLAEQAAKWIGSVVFEQSRRSARNFLNNVLFSVLLTTRMYKKNLTNENVHVWTSILMGAI